MKKTLTLLLSTSLLLLTGCTTTTSNTSELYGYSDSLTYTPQKYTVDLTSQIPATWQSLQAQYQASSPTDQTWSNDMYIYQNFGAKNMATLTLDPFSMSDIPYAMMMEDATLQTSDTTILPGLTAFIEDVMTEDTSYAAPSVVLNHAAISMYPIHLYTTGDPNPG